ncbi:MAG: hypothetical protein ABI345_11595, partial [Jatrophihabitans sp.]
PLALGPLARTGWADKQKVHSCHLATSWVIGPPWHRRSRSATRPLGADHILITARVRDVDYQVVHVNAEYSTQVSDHDPQVVQFTP